METNRGSTQRGAESKGHKGTKGTGAGLFLSIAFAVASLAIVTGLSLSGREALHAVRGSGDRLQDPYAAMIGALKQRVNSHPNNAQYRKELAEVLFRSGRWRQAAKQLREASRLAPGDGEILVMLGMALWHAGDAQSALEQFEEVLEKDPSREDVQFFRAVLLSSMPHRKKDAVNALQGIISRNPSSQWAKSALDVLAKIKGNDTPKTQPSNPSEPGSFP